MTQPTPDPIVAAVVADLHARSAAGQATYGTTLARTDLSRAERTRHAYEEALDLALYLRRLMGEPEPKAEPEAENPWRETVRFLYDKAIIGEGRTAESEGMRAAIVAVIESRHADFFFGPTGTKNARAAGR